MQQRREVVKAFMHMTCERCRKEAETISSQTIAKWLLPTNVVKGQAERRQDELLAVKEGNHTLRAIATFLEIKTANVRKDMEKLCLMVWDALEAQDIHILNDCQNLPPRLLCLDLLPDLVQIALSDNAKSAGKADTDLKSIVFSGRTRNVVDNIMGNKGITKASELARMSIAEMLKYRNCGKKTVMEIRAKLNELGLECEKSQETPNTNEADAIRAEIRKAVVLLQKTSKKLKYLT